MINGRFDESILIAMSGGVDSSAAAVMLKNSGYKIKGIIFRMHDTGMTPEELAGGKIPVNIWRAREAARRIRMDFTISDVRKEFDEKVVRYFISSNEQGIMADPCMYCNSQFIIPLMLDQAQKLECGKIATGHYARTEYDEKTGRYILRKAVDIQNDQSYMLYRLSQDQLSKLVLPLGGYEKSEIRRIAAGARLKNAQTPDSLDICFMPDNDHKAFVAEKACKTVRASNVNFVSIPGFEEENMRVRVKFRYSQEEPFACARMLPEGIMEVEFDDPAPTPAPGQSIVLYDGDVVLAGGIII